MKKPKPMYGVLSADEGGPDMWFPGADKLTFSIGPTEEQLDDVAQALIPILDEVGNMDKDVHGDKPPYVFVDQPESKPHSAADDLGFVATETGGFTLPGDEQLMLAIEGRAVMVTNTPELRQDGSCHIVLSPNENWVVKSVLMNGLDSSMEIELILAPRI